VLDRHKLEVVQVTSAEDSAKLAYADRVDLVILDSEPTTMTLEEIVAVIRSPSSASNKTSLLVLARPGGSDEARGLIGRGVNGVMLAGDPPELIARRAAGLLDIAPRTTLRLATRFLVEVADGADEALGAVVNLSATGMLVETDTLFLPGQHVLIAIDVAGQDEPLTVKAEVVRQADPGRDGIEGIGVRFLKFAGDSRQRLDAILGDAFDNTPI
jgi:Tfp pilus assembly protein PilZ